MFDLVLTGGHLVDPAQGLDGQFDVVVSDGKVAAIIPGGQAVLAKEKINVAGKLVIPGMIDTHAHVFQYVTGRFGLEADMCGVHSGVTTLIDQGGPSCMTMPAFTEYVVKPKKSRVFTFMSSYLVGGMEGHYYASLYKPDCLDVEATVKSARAHSDIVRGFKCHAEVGGFSRWGLDVMKLCSEIGNETKLPLYIHFGQLWPMPTREEANGREAYDPDYILADVTPLLKAGDILAHPFTRHPGGFVNRQGKVHGMVREALEGGLKVDVGHGSHFSFNMARIALDAGIVPDTLGADTHGYNTRVPPPPGTPEQHSDQEHMFFGKQRFSLASAMTSMLALGLPLQHVVRMVTSNVVDIFGLPKELGTLKVGNPADITVLNDDHGRFSLKDNEGTQLVAERAVTPAFCMLAGVRYEADAAILPPVEKLAA